MLLDEPPSSSQNPAQFGEGSCRGSVDGKNALQIMRYGGVETLKRALGGGGVQAHVLVFSFVRIFNALKSSTSYGRLLRSSTVSRTASQVIYPTCRRWPRCRRVYTRARSSIAATSSRNS